MTMTQERFHKISHFAMIRGVADEIGEEELTDKDIRELMDEIRTDKSVGKELGLEETERIEYSELFLKDLVSELSKRNTQHKNKDSADKTAFIDGVKLRGEPY